jgi:hypothetical protein
LFAASSGEIVAVNSIKEEMSKGNATRDDYAQALRSYTIWMDEVKSDQRERAAQRTVMSTSICQI